MFVSLLAIAQSSHPQAPPGGLGQPFESFLAKLHEAHDSLSRSQLITEYFAHAKVPVVEGSTAYFLYRGQGNAIAVPGELNHWDPSAAMMHRVEGTDLFLRKEKIPINGRVEYKLWVDSSWILDPLNSLRSVGGLGENSDLWMPEYVPPQDIVENQYVSHGRIDTIWFVSKVLNRTHPVFVYVPPGESKRKELPAVYVLDGGEYLSLGRMNIILDNLISAHKIDPILGIFVDPRTDLNDRNTNHRMTEYGASDAFLLFLSQELIPFINKNYAASDSASKRAIMGASMGGLMATYVTLKQPEQFVNCAAQSPAYFQADSAVIKLLQTISKADINAYIGTGTIHDTEIEARLVSNLLEKRGARVHYAEFPEGHNWTNWRARIREILEYFFPAR